ncbi:pentatricopeptide repeat-containing protein At5g14080 isoform X1 [Coffea eugenioides]|uniref:pentatricopeptide repeat-containing protein At5g14080 isoform X1 n=1 Tax=Coffea eugenioides TaxID=49369 RepID=UPI000F60B64D|nr:pentatricopeptide repeat-containing protein At5g14080 isoform X1 [Coffea eugenioides]
MRRRAWSGEIAGPSQVSRALISASNQTAPSRTWTPSLERILHRLGCRDSLNPTLVARVIDPFLLHHHSLALGFFNWASQQPGFSHTSATFQSVLKSLSIARQFNSVDMLLKQVKALDIHLDPCVYQSLICSHLAGRKTHIAFSIFQQLLHSAASKIQSETCNSLLAALSSEGGNLNDARKVLDEMLHRGIALTTVGFGVFVWRFCRNAQVGQVLKLLDEVHMNIGFSRLNRSIIAFLVVHGLSSQSRAPDAIPMLDDLRVREYKPDFLAYRTVAEALREMGNVVDVQNVLKKKRKLGVAPRSNDYGQFIFALISVRLVCEAKQVAQVIISGNFPLEEDALNALIGSVSTVDPYCAVSFLNFMLDKEGLPTLLTLTNLGRNLCKHGRSSELVEVFQVLSAKEYFVDTQSYNVIITFLCKAGRIKEAYQALQEMKKKGLVPDVSCYNALLEACCREDLLRPAKRLWDEMFTNCCNGNVQTYSIFIQKFVEIGEIDEAHRLFCCMFEKGVAPDVTIYTTLLGGLCRAKHLDTAVRVFNKSAEQDMKLGQTTLIAFILFLCKEGLYVPTSKLLTSCICGIENLEAHMTFLKFLADAGEVSLASEHLEQIGDKSPLMLHALHTDIMSFSSSPKLKPIVKLFQQLQENHQNF